ncbi:class I SAM-dependent methyltransferase [Nonomuraea sp. FMUSA5-5]|uniref:Class I SAM-dependent methyltransferase n=1 Tax=Nonomuraea composti TaxID=2720023 RepID=A0ABX1B893_9ACTN|nr:class I SAM-dependent methyltransferase [Nonomuraea sp. FMUSA5-5]NJP92622.1 class I SAM-dependent methyltransferase [Nonomuraea sp. FMUSA5-5]
MSLLNDRADGAGHAAIAGADLSGAAGAVEDLDRLILLGLAAHLHRHSRLGEATAHQPRLSPGPGQDLARQTCPYPGLGRDAAHGADTIAGDLGAAPRHRWIAGHWLAELHEAGLISRDAAGRYHSLYGPRRAELATARARMEAARLALGYPAELAELMLRSLRLLPALLRDEIGVQALLYPDGEPATAEAVYRGNVISRYLNAAAAEVVRAQAERATRPLRILELGAGIGATTADLLPALAGRPVEFYLFTDLSPFFLDTARRRFEAGFLRYALLDIAHDLPGRPGELDLIVAATMAHNAPHAGRLLGQAAASLAPGGRLLLIETVREHPQSLTSMPFALSTQDGPPHRLDARAGTTRTYLNREEWLGALEGSGLRVEVDLPRPGDPLAALSQRLLVATR